MSAAFTFGSLGDILTLCQIGMALGKAVGSSQGSAKTYQALKTNVDSFVQILIKVIAAIQEREHTEWMSDLDAIIKQTVNSCADDMREALAHFRARYERDLGDTGQKSSNIIRTGLKKVEFKFRETERLGNLQNNLASSTRQLSLLILLRAQ
ncbi:hypothetical protein CkaCkLH20_04700 [Colletotrichum karsti]|uniref:Fungal N-terminal domain-containing protein n=1 Tax=Colletotrichum karsti TaxID=1095194 RepID=A0A9P6I815_9PEZI|nr:uncharacterized protein CkaCkLH20_04700 [Colletotrichum karsti]KAF9877565.1 hypothetical protein CkaCkLH20_04700 [Colletotrichum karsti]